MPSHPYASPFILMLGPVSNCYQGLAGSASPSPSPPLPSLPGSGVVLCTARSCPVTTRTSLSPSSAVAFPSPTLFPEAWWWLPQSSRGESSTKSEIPKFLSPGSSDLWISCHPLLHLRFRAVFLMGLPWPGSSHFRAHQYHLKLGHTQLYLPSSLGGVNLLFFLPFQLLLTLRHNAATWRDQLYLSISQSSMDMVTKKTGRLFSRNILCQKRVAHLRQICQIISIKKHPWRFHTV